MSDAAPPKRDLSAEDEAILRPAITDGFYRHQIPYLMGIPHEEFLSTDQGRVDMDNHLRIRLRVFRDTLIPWLQAYVPLNGSRVLEIGPGTGSSTVALAETGAHVDAIDIDERVLSVAKLRAQLHGFGNTRFIAENAINLHRLSENQYDLIIFFASLEHMTYAERITALRAAWQMLAPGGFLCVFETPNRLWFWDGHTSQMPFYHWLPDDLAINYAARSPRHGFRTAFKDQKSGELLARWGRGVSFHEFELAIGDLDPNAVMPSMAEHFRRLNPSLAQEWEASHAGQFSRLLRSKAPHLPGAFFEEDLNLLIRK